MKRSVVEEAMLDDAIARPSTPARREPIPSPLSFSVVGSAVCPECLIEHESTCERFWKAYAQHNKDLRARLASWRKPDGSRLITPIPKPPECPACKGPRRPFAPICDDCEAKTHTT